MPAESDLALASQVCWYSSRMLTRRPVAVLGGRHRTAESPSALRSALLLVVVFLAVNSIRLGQLGGPRSGSDTPRYVEGAANVIAGRPYHEKQASYRGYIWVVVVSQKLLGSPNGVLAVQWLFGLVSTVLLYHVIADRAGSPLALAGSLAYVVFPDIAQWNNYVLSDSLYISAVA